MPKPTKTALAKHPKAVVLLASPVADTSKIDHDFEWFDTDEGIAEFMKEATVWAAEDVSQQGDLHHALVPVTDTTFPPTLGEIVVHSPDEAFAKAWKAKIEADPTTVIAPVATRAPAASTKKVTPKIKPKKPSAAAEALKNGGTEEDGGDVMAAKAAKSAALKERLAAKKAAAPKEEAKAESTAPKPKAKPKAADAQQHLYTLGWAVPLGRGSDGRFRSVR